MSEEKIATTSCRGLYIESLGGCGLAELMKRELQVDASSPSDFELFRYVLNNK